MVKKADVVLLETRGALTNTKPVSKQQQTIFAIPLAAGVILLNVVASTMWAR